VTLIQDAIIRRLLGPFPGAASSLVSHIQVRRPSGVTSTILASASDQRAQKLIAADEAVCGTSLGVNPPGQHLTQSHRRDRVAARRGD
jgi:hypothetical protein